MERTKRRRGERNKTPVCCLCGHRIEGPYFRYISDKEVKICVYCFSIQIPVYTNEFYYFEEDKEKMKKRIEKVPLKPGIPNFLLIDPNPKPGFTPEWTSNDELLLVNGVNRFGIGNWHQINEWIPDHSIGDIESHYFGLYINSPTAPLPEGKKFDKDFPPPPPPDYKTDPKKASEPSEKKEVNPKNPAENSGWMPFRHEFEVEFIEDADKIAGTNIIDYENETQESFQEKMHRLKVYNQHLALRRKIDRVLEEFDIMHKTEKKEFFSSKTSEQLANDEILFPFAKYVEPSMMKKLVNINHKGTEINKKVKSCYKQIQFGARSVQEGKLVRMLMKMITKDGKVDETKIDEWNSIMENIEELKDKVPESEFNPKEQTFIETHNIKSPFYKSLKDLILREYTVSNSLTLEDAISLSPQNKDIIKDMFDLFFELGWIWEDCKKT